MLWEAVWLHETEEGFARNAKLTANLLTVPPLAVLLHLAEPPRPPQAGRPSVPKCGWSRQA